MNDVKDQIQNANKTVGNLIYSIVTDIGNDLIDEGMNEDDVRKFCSSKLAQYLEEDIKIRKKPVRREKGPGPICVNPFKDKKWIPYPGEEDFVYCPDIRTNDDYCPLKEIASDKVVAMVSEDGYRDIVQDDIIFFRLNKLPY